MKILQCTKEFEGFSNIGDKIKIISQTKTTYIILNMRTNIKVEILISYMNNYFSNIPMLREININKILK